jgi:hypothetical protein
LPQLPAIPKVGRVKRDGKICIELGVLDEFSRGERACLNDGRNRWEQPGAVRSSTWTREISAEFTNIDAQPVHHV